MSGFEEIKAYLPKYLSDEAVKDLFDNLKTFPNNIDGRLFAFVKNYQDYPLQGDGIKNLLLVNFPDTTIRPAPCMLISNTCDMSPENLRTISMHCAYAPIFKLTSYVKMLQKNNVYDETAMNNHLDLLRQQRISNLFYLPSSQNMNYEGVVFLDRLNNCSLAELHNSELANRKLFSLSDYGFYLFLFKLSIHFTRIRERIQRD